MEILKKNPYTLQVLPNRISFTKEFKEDFWNFKKQGYTIRQCFINLGYDYDVVTHSRAIGIYQQIKKEATSRTGFSDISQPRARIDSTDGIYDGLPEHVAMMKMQSNLLHMRQEIDFLKKY